MPKVIVDGTIFNIEDITDKRLVEMIEETGARRNTIEAKNRYEIKELSAVDPYTIGIGIGAVITWIIYWVSQSQKNEFKSKFEGKLEKKG